MKLLALKAAIFGVILVVAAVFVMSVSGPYEDGLDAYDSGDYATALRLWRPLAEQGYAPAQNKLGFMHNKGRGVPQDDVLSYMWFNLAASRYPLTRLRDNAVEGRDAVAERMTPAQIAEAQKLVREWRPRDEQAE